MTTLPKPYDNGMRRLMAICAQDFLDWVVPGTFFTGKLSEQFESFSIEADAIHETIQCDQLALCHFEFQSTGDTHMAQRLLEYMALAYRRYKRPISSYVIYLKPSKNIPVPPLKLTRPDGKAIFTLDYEVIILPDTPYKELLATGLKGLLPLVPLSAGGATREVIEEVIMRLAPAHDTIAKEVLALTQLFASLAFDKDDVENQKWIIGRFAMYQDILRDTPSYQHIMNMGLQEGLEKGLEKGREEGLEKGREEGLEKERQARLQNHVETLLAIVQARFPTLDKQAQKQVGQIKDLAALEKLVIGVGSALTLEDAQRVLRAEPPKK